MHLSASRFNGPPPWLEGDKSNADSWDGSTIWVYGRRPLQRPKKKKKKKSETWKHIEEGLFTFLWSCLSDWRRIIVGKHWERAISLNSSVKSTSPLLEIKLTLNPDLSGGTHAFSTGYESPASDFIFSSHKYSQIGFTKYWASTKKVNSLCPRPLQIATNLKVNDGISFIFGARVRVLEPK